MFNDLFFLLPASLGGGGGVGGVFEPKFYTSERIGQCH